MITKKMVEDAYRDDVIELILSPNGDGVAAKIGDGWFYFGGMTAEEYDNVDLFRKEIPEKTILTDIYETLENFTEWEELCDEYGYYNAILEEKGYTDYE